MYMKQKSKKHFGDRIVTSEVNGEQNVVTFHSTVAKVFRDFHNQQEDATN